MPDLCASDFLLFLQAEDGIRDVAVTGVQTCALPISLVLRVLEHEGRLEIDVRVKAGGQPEVAVHERAGLLVELERLLFGHSSSFRIAAAAAAGSGAAVIGRPTTT